jgi:uncharacterized delta-60 repeat protein
MNFKNRFQIIRIPVILLAILILILPLTFTIPGMASLSTGQPPEAVDDCGPGFITDQYKAFITTNVLANDSDPDGNPLFVNSFDDSSTKGKVQYIIPGSLDDIFGTKGKVVTYAGRNSDASGVALQADGKIVVVGSSDGSNLALARYMPDGNLDPTFNGAGIVIVNFVDIAVRDRSYDSQSLFSNRNREEGPDYRVGTVGNGVVIQQDGKIVVTGMLVPYTPEVFVARFNTDGSLDHTFNGTGYVATKLGYDSRGQSIALQPDGKIVVAGKSDNDFSVLRYLSNGTLDTSFNGDGWVTTDFGGSDWGWAMALQKDGKIVVAGNSWPSPDSNYSNFVLARYNTDGSLDTSFNDDGKVTTDFGIEAYGTSIALQPDNKIIVAGSVYGINQVNIALVRYNSDGNLDISFNGDGKVIASFNESSYGEAVVVQPNDKIIVAGDTVKASGFGFGMARYNPNGSLDTSFNIDGNIIFTNFGYKDLLHAVTLQPDGKIILAGVTDQGIDYAIALSRYNEDGTFYYDPNGQFNWLDPGQQAFDTFMYVASDGVLSDTATVTISINGVVQIFLPTVIDNN